MDLTDNGRAVLERRYLIKDKAGELTETPEDLFRRVATAVAAADAIHNPNADVDAAAGQFYHILSSLQFLPNSPTLMNAGRELGQLSGCFVLPVEDSMESIFEAVKNTALIHKSGGGTGFSFNRLRPEGSVVGSTGGVASGPVSFMRAFDTATDVIKQGGKRRGANMAILNVDHPDIIKFITCKDNQVSFTNFNISVAVTEEFMEAVEACADYTVGLSKEPAAEVFRLIVECAWKHGDPGIIFLDRINRDNPTPHLGDIESCNPCGEQPLLPYESCNLGSINLAMMTAHTRDVNGGEPCVDYPRLTGLVHTAVRFLDNVITVNRYPLAEVEELTRKTRKIGLGVMGFADMLIKLGIPYNSEKALEIAEKVMGLISHEAREASIELARERGAYPACESDGLMRNATRTTIAPTGSLSIIAGCSSGIEPLFALSYTRTILDNDQFSEVHPLFKEALAQRGLYSDALMQEVAEKGSIQGIQSVPEDMRALFATSHDITPEWHVRMQAAFQRHTDNAVSKTINFPHDATVEDVERAYMLAYKENCKGITIYRDRSRDAQVLSIDNGIPATVEKAMKVRPTVTTGLTEKVRTGCGNLYVTVNCDDNKELMEVFCLLGKAGGCASGQLEAITRLISMALRSGVEVKSIIEHLTGIRCPSPSWGPEGAVLSCPDAIASVLNRHHGDGVTYKRTVSQNGNLASGQCPECGSTLFFQEGCLCCPSCGYTRC